MPLAAGDRLGPYGIVAPIGAGGMGRSIAPGTRASTALWRSKFSPPRSPDAPSCGSGWSAKLLDFGLAKVLAAQPIAETDATQTMPLTAYGTLLGTVPYMALEQFEVNLCRRRRLDSCNGRDELAVRAALEQRPDANYVRSHSCGAGLRAGD